MSLKDLSRDDLEVWGFNGTPSVVCSRALPIVRQKSTDRFCSLSVRRQGGPLWSSRKDIEEHFCLGRITKLSRPLSLPEDSFPLLDSRQPLVAWAEAAFWSALNEHSVQKRVIARGWLEQDAVLNRTEPGAEKPSEFRKTLWIMCAIPAKLDKEFDDWANEHKNQYDQMLISQERAWGELEQLADHGLCAAKNDALRFELYVRYCAAFYYRDMDWEKSVQVFRIVVRNEFPTVTWDYFKEEMRAVVDRSEEMLRLRMARHMVPAPEQRADIPWNQERGFDHTSVSNSSTFLRRHPAFRIESPTMPQAGATG